MKIKSFGISLAVVAILSVGFTGCGVKVANYHASADNVTELKELNIKINVNDFTATKSNYKFMCRLANDVTTPNKEPFETYIENAFVEELKMAGMYSESSKITISGHLNMVDVSSGMTDAHWTFDITVSSNNGKSFRVKHKREYSSSFLGGIACGQDMPGSFQPTVKELISKIIKNPQFRDLIK
ncbi:hypothetical protein [Poseidonibacter lekithochrous]|uniref:hypothetical protein n=1 Tax=Poseidonibacter lekithochrous TaxID=1904463 RepID=UPI0008FC2289|nr:hypothetical protein [Poseidonibacter lekithochrous]QKJ22761.1 hypothetical protein ALEK_1490 [Poseidonibacter lekithochrous]